MASDKSVRLEITLPADVAKRLETGARERGWTPESLAADCVAQSLELPIRYRVLLERLERVDTAMVDLATFVGEATAEPSAFDLTKICRFHDR